MLFMERGVVLLCYEGRMDRTDEIFLHWSCPLYDLGFYLFIYFYTEFFFYFGVSPVMWQQFKADNGFNGGKILKVVPLV